MKFRSLVLSALVACLPLAAFAGEPRANIKAPLVAKVSTLIVLDASDSEGDDFLWESTTGESFRPDTNGKIAYFVTGTPGKYRFILVAGGTVDGKAKLARALAEVIVDGVTPPIPPSPPDPPIPPDPKPPDPKPIPSTVGNLRVLILFESSAKLDIKQLSALNGGLVRKYLSDKCITDPDGLPAWRMWDRNIDAAGESALWKTALTAAQADTLPIPKVAIYAGTTLVKVVPLPANDVEMVAMLKQWGEK